MWCPTTPITAVELEAANGTCYLPVPQSFLNPLHPWLPCRLASVDYPVILPKSSFLSSLSSSTYSLLRLRLAHMSIHSHSQARECHKMPKCISLVPWMFFATLAVWKQPYFLLLIRVNYPCKMVTPLFACWTQGTRSTKCPGGDYNFYVLWRGIWVARVWPLWAILIVQGPNLKRWEVQTSLFLLLGYQIHVGDIVPYRGLWFSVYTESLSMAFHSHRVLPLSWYFSCTFSRQTHCSMMNSCIVNGTACIQPVDPMIMAPSSISCTVKWSILIRCSYMALCTCGSGIF